MQTVIWAFGSMLLVMLIVNFLPIGFTYKGKFITVLTSFALSLLGLAAVTSLSLIFIFCFLVVLTFLSSYILHNRIGSILFSETSKLDEEIFDRDEGYPISEQFMMEKNSNSNYSLPFAEPSLKLNDEKYSFIENRPEGKIPDLERNWTKEMTKIETLGIDEETLDDADFDFLNRKLK